jgi:hypothetical protein
VLVIQEGLRVSAESVEMDRRTKLGTFFTASGTARLTEQTVEKSMFGTMEPEVAFAAAKVQKMARRPTGCQKAGLRRACRRRRGGKSWDRRARSRSTNACC